jgi:hypothetical protein
MRRLVLFLALTALLLALEMTFDWWVDPFGQFWKGGALRDARAANCLLGEDVVGNAYLPFKLAVFRSRPTRTIVLGSSRTLKIASWPGERDFANLGVPAMQIADMLYLLRHIPAPAPRLTVYLGLDVFMFNPAYHPFDFRPGFYADVRYLLSRSTFQQAVDAVRATPAVIADRWRRLEVGGSCVIARATPGLAWRLDGSRLWAFELQPGLYRPPAAPFTTNLAELDNGYYAGWTRFATERVRELAQALALARSRGWRVVGFSPPDPPRVVRFLAASPSIGPKWREFGRAIPALFRRYGFTYLDLRNARSVPCAASDFVDLTFHTDAPCSMRIRGRLDAAARVH